MQKRGDHFDPDGGAYGRPPQSHDAEITEVGPGTPCGELMRRYWQPVEISARVGTRPKRIRILGEDLILFRDASGRAGVITPRCAHRGADMYYGKVDAHGIRCPYHGWQFDIAGRCLDQPCEPQGGPHRERVRQPWYPVEERYGLVFAYMGPPAKRPVLPRWDILENLRPDQKLVPDASSYSAGGDEHHEIAPWNWLQDWENTMDPFHTVILHTAFSGAQFAPAVGIMPRVEWDYTGLGMHYRAYRTLPDGRRLERIVEVMLPNVRSVPNVALEPRRAEAIGWLVPTDDFSHAFFHVTKVPADYRGVPMVTAPNFTKPWAAMTEDEHWETPGDWEIQRSQGAITLHSEERLATSDRGIVMLRRLLRQQAAIVKEGGDPAGVAFDPAQATNAVGAGNYFR